MIDDTFTAKHIHQCYPWISSSTLVDRIRSELIPVTHKPEGPGGAYEVTFPQLVHIGAQDELSVLGAWRALKQLAELEIEFVPLPWEEDDYNRNKPPRLEDEPPYYYEQLQYSCRIHINILHRRPPPGGDPRLKRSARVFQILYYPDDKLYKQMGPYIPASEALLVKHDDEDYPLFAISSARINVDRIARHCRLTLGLETRPEVDMDAIWQEVLRERNQT